jgi:hypothetical protein
MAPDKTLELYGFPFFYQKLWPLLKNDIMALVTGFYNGLFDISKLNGATIYLIPKV